MLIYADAKISFRNFAQGCQTCLESLLISLEFHLKVSSKRHVAEGRNEDSLRRGIRSGGYSIRQLVDVTEESSLEQSLLYGCAIQGINVFLTKIRRGLLSVCLYLDAEHLASLTTLNGGNLTAHWRSELHLWASLVDKQGVSGVDMVAFAHHHLRCNSLEGCRHECVLGCLYHRDGYILGSFTRKVNVQAFT